MIVELYGLPASGKSTFARSLAARGATRIRVRSRAALLWYNLRFFFRSPLRFLRALWWALASGGSPALRYYKLMNLLQYNARWEKARGVLASGLYRLRFVTHLDVDAAGVQRAADAMAAFCAD